MTPLAASLLLGAGGLLLLGWLVGLVYVTAVRRPPKGEALAATGLSAFQILGGTGCFMVFGAIWAGGLAAFAAGEGPLDRWVLFWSGLLALVGMTILWMALVRRVWCGSSALVQRTWRGRLITVPYGEIAGEKAAFSFDDVTIPWGERRLVLDRSLPDFDQVAEFLEKRGVDLSGMPPKRTFLSRQEGSSSKRR